MPPIRVQSNESEMIDVATLILKAGNVRERLADLLLRNAPRVRQRLYVQLHPQQTPNELLSVLPIVYEKAAKHCPQLDVRLLLGVSKPQFTQLFDDNLTDKDFTNSNDGMQHKTYDYVVLGGTFDRLHYGHKLLLSTCILLANKCIVCGVTDKEMIHKKMLWELIQPVDQRIDSVHDFINDVSSGVELRAEPIIDPFGPSIVDKQLQCIVVSKETYRGGEAVNKRRNERGLSTLDIVEIGLLDGSDEILEETKLSSSAARRFLLGRHLKPPKTPNYDYACEKYVIGLTGGTCSGKTHISNYLRDEGCEIIDCDKIGHDVMKDSEELREKIGDAFGTELIKDGAVDRKSLGALVFKNKDRLKQLTNLIWPIMAEQVLERIREAEKQIIIVDAAVLIDAGWDKFVHEVWTTMIPREEAIKRAMERDNLTEELAQDRVNSQPSNSERISSSHVIFCSLWEYKETERQVQLALNAVNERINNGQTSIP